jgi:hypothetical protein
VRGFAKDYTRANPQSEIRNPKSEMPLLSGVLNFAQAGRMLADASFRSSY